MKSCTQHLIVRLACSWFIYCFHKPDEKLSQWNRGCQESIVKDGKQGENDEVCKNWTDRNCGGWIQIGDFGSNFSQYIQRWVFTVMFKILGAAFQPVDTKYCQSLVQRAVTSGKCLGTASFFMIPRTLHILLILLLILILILLLILLLIIIIIIVVEEVWLHHDREQN